MQFSGMDLPQPNREGINGEGEAKTSGRKEGRKERRPFALA